MQQARAAGEMHAHGTFTFAKEAVSPGEVSHIFSA